jgi:O-antigen ligase
MKITMFVLIMALIAKDTSQLNDPYLMRGLAQALCLGVGGVWIMKNLNLIFFKKYWPIVGYVSALLVSVVYSNFPNYVLLQVISLTAVLLFFLAYFEYYGPEPEKAVKAVVNTTILLYTVVSAISLILVFTYPDIAYGSMKNGNSGIEYRFRGLFPKSGMLASAAGLTIGLVWFSNYSALVKLPTLALSVICLVMTLSRTYWIALIVAGLMTYWTYESRSRKWILATIILAISLWFMLKIINVQIDFEHMKFLRVQTISTLTGRVSLWQEGLKAFYLKPFFGYGYTTGATGLEIISRKNGFSELGVDASRDVGRATLHNGYLQSLLDSGIVGTLFYVLMIILALWRIGKLSEVLLYRGPFFVLTFMAICNFSQSAIYSASVFDSVLFFAFMVFAMGTSGFSSPALGSEFRREENQGSFRQSLRYKIVNSK